MCAHTYSGACRSGDFHQYVLGCTAASCVSNGLNDVFGMIAKVCAPISSTSSTASSTTTMRISQTTASACIAYTAPPSMHNTTKAPYDMGNGTQPIGPTACSSPPSPSSSIMVGAAERIERTIQRLFFLLLPALLVS